MCSPETIAITFQYEKKNRPGIDCHVFRRYEDDYARVFIQAEKPERFATVEEAMRYKMMRTLSVEPFNSDPERRVSASGIHFLMAVKLGNWLSRTFVIIQ